MDVAAEAFSLPLFHGRFRTLNAPRNSGYGSVTQAVAEGDVTKSISVDGEYFVGTREAAGDVLNSTLHRNSCKQNWAALL